MKLALTCQIHVRMVPVRKITALPWSLFECQCDYVRADVSARRCRNIFTPYRPTISTKTASASQLCSGGNPAFGHGPLTSYADWRALWFSSVSPGNVGNLSQFTLRSLPCAFFRNPSNRAVADPRLKQHGYWDRPFQITCISLFTFTLSMDATWTRRLLKHHIYANNQ